MKKSDKFNSSGCLDLTAFQALKNIEREEAAKNPEPSRKKKKKNAGNPPVNDRQNPA